MNTLFVLTLLDYQYFKNSRVHHIIGKMKGRFASVTVMYKGHIYHEMPLSEQIKYFLLFFVKRYSFDNQMFFHVNPFLNHAEALGIKITGQNTSKKRKGISIRRIFWRTFGILGLFSEMSIIVSFLLSYLFFVRQRFDVFIGQGPMEVSVGYILQRLGFVRLLVYDDIDYAPGYSPHNIRKTLLDFFERYLIKRSDIVISVGNYLAELRKNRTGRKVLVIPNGVDYELFQTAQDKIPHQPTLIYMGFVEEWSGLDLVLGALKNLKPDLPDIRLLVFGHTTPQYLEKLKDISKQYGIDENVFYKGNHTHKELIKHLKEADIGLAVFKPIELRKYAFSLKIIEYMAAGLPVVATVGTQSAWVVDQYQCGVTVPYNEEGVYHGICSIMKDQEKYIHFADNAKKYSMNYKWDYLMDSVYKEILFSYRAKYSYS